MIQNTTHVKPVAEVEQTLTKKRRAWLPFLAREWWEVAHTETIANDVHVFTDRPIRYVYVNGDRFTKV